LPNRLKSYVEFENVTEWLNILKPTFNFNAAKSDKFGIVYHPK